MTVQELLSSLLPRTNHPLLVSPSEAEGEKHAPPLHPYEELLAHVLGVERVWLLAHPDALVHPARVARCRRLAARHARGEPLAQLLGEQWFYGRPFRVTRDVLIPRPETELLIDYTLAAFYAPHQNRAKKIIPILHDRVKLVLLPRSVIVDVGTGSGCVAVTLAAEIPRARVIATDTSPAALRITRGNARRHGVADRITFLRSNLLDRVLRPSFVLRHSSFVMLANLPYLTTAEWRALPHSLKHFEPRTAFDGGPDGLVPYRALLLQLHALTAHGLPLTAFLEIDPRRYRALAALARRMLPEWRATFHRDLAGRWRVLELTPSKKRGR